MKAIVKSKLNLENRVALQDVIPLKTPFLLYLDPSSLCNFKCQFCPMGHSQITENLEYKRQIMDFDLFKKTIDSLSDFEDNIKVLRMNKIGEPLMNKKIVQMVDYAKKCGKIDYIDFATNAGLLTQEISLGLTQAGLNRLNISIEGVSDEHYKKFCSSKVNFNNLVENIKFLYKNKKNTEIVIKIPSNYITKQEQEEFMQIFGNYCDRIFVENLTSIWPNFDINKVSNVLKIEEKNQYEKEAKDRNVCSYIFYSMVINASGTVSACCPDWEEKLVIGDLHNNSLYEIWNSEKLKSLQLQHLKGGRKCNSICGNCGHIKYCQVDDIDEYAKDLLKKF